MSSFDNWWEENCMMVSADRTEAEDIYNIGAQSRQAEIEQSYNSGFYDGRNGTPCEVVNLQNEIDELKKRVDSSLEILDKFNCPQEYGIDEIWMAIDILKGNKS